MQPVDSQQDTTYAKLILQRKKMMIRNRLKNFHTLFDRFKFMQHDNNSIAILKVKCQM